MLFLPRRISSPLLLFVLVWAGSGCVSYQPVEPGAVPDASAVKLASRIEPWWRVFGDSRLDATIETMLRENLDLQAAASRILQARYALEKARASFYPTADLSLGASRSVNHFEEGTLASGGFSGSVRAGYEVDLFGRLESLSEASRQEWRQRRFDYETLMISLSADMVDNWYGIAYARESARYLQERVELARREVALLKRRYHAQKARLVDLLSQESALKQMESDLSDFAYQKQLYRGALATLMGTAPEKLTVQGAQNMPSTPAWPMPEVSSETLLKRPDIRAAYAALSALDKRAAAAVSAQYPRFSLTASLSENEMRFNNLFDLWYTSVAANLAAPIFDAGSRKADAQIALARRKEALLQLKQSLVAAAVEVSNALKAVKIGRRNYRLIEEKLQIDTRKMVSYRAAYLHGTEDFKRYLDARLALLSTRLQEIRSRYDLLKAYVTLYRATASGWQTTPAKKDAM